MARFTIYSKDGQIRRHEGEPQYSGSYMGVDFVEFRTISSPTPIDWQIGDYVDYYRTGKRYKLYSLPMPKKVARKGEYGASFEYSNVQLHGATKELEIAPFRDLVTKDNKIHFSTRPEVSTYEDVYGIARRIQECMNDLYPNKWRIEVYDTDDDNLLSLLGETKEYSVSNGSCLDALSQIYDTWKNVGWIHTYDSINSVDVITIGRANVRDLENTSDAFAYGIGKGLTSIKKASANNGEFATRLYIYGSERNIQTRYYNGLNILNKDSVDIRNLMLPIEKWGKTDGLPDASKAYLQADDSIIEKYGLIPRTVYFDGTDNEEIYPSIKGLTMVQVRQAMIAAGEEDSEYLPTAHIHRIDKIEESYSSSFDDGSKEQTEKNMTFHLGLYQMGFNIADQGKLTSEGFATISMKSGACAGRDFKVRRYADITYEKVDGSKCLVYEVERNWDESLGMGFPNKTYPINDGDEFVLLDIPMPGFYIDLAEDSLFDAGEKMLADYTRVSAFYEPSVDAIQIKAGGRLLQAGMFMQVYDEDIIDTADNKDYVLIDTLTIDEKSDLPIYRVTLREQKRSARTYSVLEDMITDAKEITKQEIAKSRQYTDRRFASARETLSMLVDAIAGFTDAISPITVRTMAMLVGNESNQFRFTTSASSLTEVVFPMVYDSTTKQVKTSSQTHIKHLTLGINSVTPGERAASEYKGWSMPIYNSEVLEDTNARYVYIKASKTSASATYVLSETPIDMEGVSGYYHFLVGILNSEYNGSRDFVTLYGFTEVLPGQITTDILRSSNGNLIIDLVNAVITAKNGARINGDITIGSDSSGLENFSEWSDKQSQIDTANTNANKAIEDAKTAQDTANTADAATKVLEQQITDVETGLNKSIGEINQKLDGVVESYFDDYTPLRTNEPARTWIREETEADHIGDTFTNTATEGDDAGKSWRWLEQEDGTYDWQQIADSDAARALVLAGQAQTAADGKNTTFLVKPNKAYKKGDIWIIGSDHIPTGYKQGDILTATRDNESYASSDWSKLVRYIGDDALSATREELEEAIENAEKAAKDYTDKGKAALQDSIDTLEQTKASVESVDAITKSDGLISAAEQRAIEAAEAAADAAQKAAETNANAYADGEIKKAEQEAIDTANANLEAAKAELNESIARLDEETADAMDAAEAAATKAEAAQSEAATATETSNAAKDIAGAAKGLAEAADSNASQAVNSAEEANAKALAAEGIAQQAQELADSAQMLANTANENAASAAKDASDAKEEASVASGKLSNWASDSVISPFEKQGVKDEYAFVVADKEDIDKQVAKYNVEDNTFETAYNTYKSDLETIVNATTESVAIPTGMSTHQSEYYSARTTILEAISTAAKEVADNAQSAADTAQETADNAKVAADKAQEDAEAAQKTADEAKAAADAAKLATDNLNNDLVFSLTEKRSIRSKLKDINPSETQAILVNTFTLGAVESKGSGSWSKVTDEADANYGWYASNMHTDSSYAIAKVNLVNVVKGSSVTVHIMSRAESTYDYTMLGAIDTELSSPTDTTTGVVAHTRGKQGQDISYTFTNLKAGSHFFCVYYRKDSSTSTSPDNGYFKIDDALFLKGSLGDYLALCKEKGISGSDAITKATSLFAYLYNRGVWNNTDTIVNKSDDFRNTVYGLFQDYYAAITGIQQAITKSDYEYLTEAFGKSKNLNVEGVVMSQLMAVRNKDEEVEAIFNGSDYAEDTSHGKLILAGGIPEETSSGSTDLKERTKEATTRIYEDGHVETNDIEAVNGTFSGALKLKFQTVTAGTTHTLTESDSSSIYLPVGYMVSTELVLPNNDVFDGILLNVFCYPRITKGEAISKVSGTILCPGQLGIGTNVVSEIEFPNGGFAQFTYSALKQEWVLTNLQAKNALVSDARVITTAKTAASPNVLNILDHSVFVNLTSGTCYIDLPKNPQDGQEYYIESRGANMSIKMYQQGYSLYSGNTADAGYSISQKGRALLRFKYYAEASLWVYAWLNRNS